MEKVTYNDFTKLDLRVAKILEAERVEGSDKLIKLQVSLGEKIEEDSESGNRQIVAGIGKAYEPEDLIGKNITIIANLEPRVVFGVESQGMLLAAKDEENFGLITVDGEMSAGVKVG